jgi:hypothetical protein
MSVFEFRNIETENKIGSTFLFTQLHHHSILGTQKKPRNDHRSGAKLRTGETVRRKYRKGDFWCTTMCGARIYLGERTADPFLSHESKKSIIEPDADAVGAADAIVDDATCATTAH